MDRGQPHVDVPRHRRDGADLVELTPGDVLLQRQRVGREDHTSARLALGDLAGSVGQRVGQVVLDAHRVDERFIRLEQDDGIRSSGADEFGQRGRIGA